MELFRAVDNYVEFCTDSSLDLVSMDSFTCNIRLCHIHKVFFITSVCYINNESCDFLGVQVKSHAL